MLCGILHFQFNVLYNIKIVTCNITIATELCDAHSLDTQWCLKIIVSRPDPGVFWRDRRNVLCLPWLLHNGIGPTCSCWGSLLASSIMMSSLRSHSVRWTSSGPPCSLRRGSATQRASRTSGAHSARRSLNRHELNTTALWEQTPWLAGWNWRIRRRNEWWCSIL